MNFKSILLLLILIVSELVSGQSFTLKGKVTDAKTNSPIQGAVVFISYNYMTYTNGDGEYSINELSEVLMISKFPALVTNQFHQT